MSASTPPDCSPTAPISRGRTTRALLALGMGGFAIGTGEFVIMGLLPDVAQDLDVSIAHAGGLISAYALGVVVGAPVLAVLAASWPRRSLLLALASFYALANLVVALMPTYGSIALARFASGFPHGTFFGVAALVAATLVPVNQRGRAVGYVMLGLSLAIVLGAPLATWLGDLVGWRAAYLLVAALATLTVVLVRLWVPYFPPIPDARPLRELGALARPMVWLTLGTAGVGFAGMFCVFSYIKPTLVHMTGMEAAAIPWVLALFGLGSVGGNLLGARLADRALIRTIAGILLFTIALLLGYAWWIRSLPTALVGVFLLGGVGALGPALQIRLMDVAGDAQTLAAALNHSAFNFANALGAWLGGVSLTLGLGWASLGWVGATASVAGLLVFAASVAWARYMRDRLSTVAGRP